MGEYGKITRNVVKEYAELHVYKEYGYGEDEKNKKLRKATMETVEKEVFEEIRKDIYNLEKEKIIKDIEKEMEEKEKNKRISQIKFILIEGIILGMLVGLLTNQITDIISYSKGEKDYIITLIIIIILLILSVIFAFAVYFNKLQDFFFKDKEKK